MERRERGIGRRGGWWWSRNELFLRRSHGRRGDGTGSERRDDVGQPSVWVSLLRVFGLPNGYLHCFHREDARSNPTGGKCRPIGPGPGKRRREEAFKRVTGRGIGR